MLAHHAALGHDKHLLVLGLPLVVTWSLLLVERLTYLRKQDPHGTTLQQQRPRLLATTALASLLAAVVHVIVVPAHLREWALAGVFFLVLTAVQGAAAVLVINRPDRPLLVANAIGNASVVLLWAVSRSTGLPIGPEAGSPEPIGAADLIASAAELVIVAGCLLLLYSEARSQASSAASRSATTSLS